jgi:hypothetical protein
MNSSSRLSHDVLYHATASAQHGADQHIGNSDLDRVSWELRAA